MSIISLLVAITLLIGLSIFPGVFFKSKLSSLKNDEKLISIIFISLGFWVILPYFISLLRLPMDLIFYGLLLSQVLIFTFFNWKKATILKFKISFSKPFNWVFVVVLLLYFLPFLFMEIPPGVDTTMHGYISTLILHYNGVPSSFEPIIPYDNFSSYSTGYNFISAYLAGFSPANLLASFKITATLPYALAILSIYFLLRQFYTKKIAIIGSIIPFMVSSVIQGSIGWGGNPTVLGFAFSVFTAGLLYKAFKEKNRPLLLISSFPLAAMPLIHAIPAIGFIYALPLSLIVFLIYYSKHLKWTLVNGIYLLILTVVLLLPFLINLEIESSEELTVMIKKWQQEMTHHKYGDNLFDNILVTFGRINNRISDNALVLSLISILFLVVKKRWNTLKIVFSFFLLFFVLFINSNYWFLPMSEILYPERIVFFVVVCISFLLSDFLKVSFQEPLFKVKNIPFNNFVIVAFLILSLVQYNNKYLKNIYTNPIPFNKEIKESFDWIAENTCQDDLIFASYWDAGCWIPALTKRSIVGGHIHFIHIVANCNEKMITTKKKKFLFITKKDIQEKKEILKRVNNGNVVFQNNEVKIIAL